MDATLKEITELVKGVKKPANQRNARLSFAIVYPDKEGKPTLRQVGQVLNGRPTNDDRKTLQELKFEGGDFIDLAILV